MRRHRGIRPGHRLGMMLLLAALLQVLLCLPLSAETIPAPPKDAKCPVCGMFAAKYADWATSLAYKDATRVYFDGPKDLFTYYLNPKRYDPARKRSDVVSIDVKDYYSLAVIDGRQAFFVVGSNISGPMGNELIPFAKKGDAGDFLKDHRGKRILRFGEVTPAVLKSLE